MIVASKCQASLGKEATMLPRFRDRWTDFRRLNPRSFAYPVIVATLAETILSWMSFQAIDEAGQEAKSGLRKVFLIALSSETVSWWG